MITTIPFSGFYESSHSYELDRALEDMVSDSSGCHPVSDRLAEEIWDGLDWSVAMHEYAREYAEYFAIWLGGEYGIKLKYESMSSPREYNFTTDRIFCEISQRDVRKLLKAVKRENLVAAAKQRFTSYDGFLSFYSADVDSWGNVVNWDHNQIGTLIVAAVAQLEDEEWEYRILENMSGNGEASDAVYAALNDKGKRISKIAYYLRQREKRQYRTAS